MSTIKHSIICLVLLVTALGVHAQGDVDDPKNNSPYSRFGIGNLFPQYFAASNGMAGLSAAFNDPYHLNLVNPASLAYLQATAFEVGMYAQYANLKSEENTDDIWSGNLNYMALGFPLKNQLNKVLDRNLSPWNFGMSFSLMPYSDVGYQLDNTLVGEEFGETTGLLTGNGGTYRFYWGGGAKYKDLSFGLKLGYQFGQITNDRIFTLDDLEPSFNSRLYDETSITGFVWDFGVMYTHNFKELNDKGVLVPTGRKVTFGINGHPSHSFNTNTNFLYSRENVIEYDTIFASNDVAGSGTLPAEFSAGVTYEIENKFLVGAEYSIGNWSQYENTANPESLKNTWRAALGVEYTPNFDSYNSYFSRMTYRLGAFYGTDPRSADGEQLKKYGLTLGTRFPIFMARQKISFVNLSLEAGKFGLPDALEERYARVVLGFTLNDNTWFFKRKFN